MKVNYIKPQTLVAQMLGGAQIICASDDHYYTNEREQLHVSNAGVGQEDEWGD